MSLLHQFKKYPLATSFRLAEEECIHTDVPCFNTKMYDLPQVNASYGKSQVTQFLFRRALLKKTK